MLARTLVCVLATIVAMCLTAGSKAAESTRPNIVFILADDLGFGDLGSYGQTKIRTPHLDRLAAEGKRMTVHYSGNNVCAPSRCVLLTGKHPGHAFVRNNRAAVGFPEGQTPVPEGALQLPLTLKKLGYTTGSFGKWGLGPMTSTGDPLQQGIDRFFGYNCQTVAHNYYPTQLWDNDKQFALNNPKFAPNATLAADADPQAAATYANFRGNDFAPDLIAQQALTFVRDNKDKPFFLYYPTTVPHLALQVPDDSLAEYEGKFPEEPYLGDRGYLPHRTPRAAYAAMVTRMDREMGRLFALVSELGLDDRTIFVFTSDNGPLYDKLGGTDCDFFQSAGSFRGHKGSMYEGGVRVPCIVRWKGRITPGTMSDRVTGFEDWLPTLLDLIGLKDQTPGDIDGISFAPTLLAPRRCRLCDTMSVAQIDGINFIAELIRPKQEPRPFLYRESRGYGGQQFVRVGDWKAVRQGLHPAPSAEPKPGPIELYDLAKDPSETTDVAAQNPAVVERLAKLLREQHVPSALFPLRALD